MNDNRNPLLSLVSIFIIGALMSYGLWIIAHNGIESRTIIIPEKRLVTDGKKIDTIYVYRQNKTN